MKKVYDRFCMEFFSTLANPLRIGILHSLLRKEKNVSELTAELEDYERTLVSHSLAKMLKVKLIFFKKKGKERIYYPNEKLVVPLFLLVENFVCSGCSFRKTCKILRRRGFDEEVRLARVPDGPCKGCR